MATILLNTQVLAQSVQVRRSPHPPYLVSTGEYKATIKLTGSSWMATMGVMHGYDIAKCTSIRTTCTSETLTPSTILGAYWRT
jgi:hypothetical protein